MSFILRSFLFCNLILGTIACGSEPLSVPARVTDKSVQSIELMGLITDNNGKPLSGATVTLGTASTFTTPDGTFNLRTKTVKVTGFTITCSKSGYFTVTKRLIPNSSFVSATISLPEIEIVDIIERAQNDTIEKSRCTLLFEPNSFMRGTTEYNANAQCAFHVLDGQNAGYTLSCDGNGINDNPQSSAFNRTYFSSLGHYRIAVLDNDGKPLALRQSKTITMLTPVPPSLSSAPADCPLWYYDTETQMWMRKGNAVYDQSQNVYVSSLDRIGTWMLAFEDETGIISGTITCGNAPVKGILVNAGIRTVVTDSLGQYSAIAPVGQHIVVVERVLNGGLTAPARTVTISEKDNQQTMNLSLQVCGITVSGTVVDRNSKPVNALLTVQSADGAFLVSRPIINGSLFITVPPLVALTVTVQTAEGKKYMKTLPSTAAGGAVSLGKITMQ